MGILPVGASLRDGRDAHRPSARRPSEIVRRRLGAAIENGDRDGENADDTAMRTETKPAFVKLTNLVTEVIRENGRETNRRADQ